MKNETILPGFNADVFGSLNQFHQNISFDTHNNLPNGQIIMQRKKMPPYLGGFSPVLGLFSWCDTACDIAQGACSLACTGSGPAALGCIALCTVLGSSCRAGCN